MQLSRTVTQGTWAARHCPSWCFTIFDIAERLGCSVRHARRLIKQHGIKTGLLVRPVRLANGSIVQRRLVTFTPSSLEALLVAHSGLKARADAPARTSLRRRAAEVTHREKR